MFKLYFGNGSCALASHLLLEEVGADYEAVRVDLAAGEQHQADFRRVNSKGRVPALVTPDGILTETPAILVYIAQQFPAFNLAPLDDPYRFAQLQAFNSYLCSTVHVAHAHAARGSRFSDDPAIIEGMKVKVPEMMAASFDLIEKEMFEGPWVMGDQYSVCDPYLFTLARWLKRDGVDIQDFPKVAAHFDAMQQRKASESVLKFHTR
jgi:glutathione S-transferase